MTWRCFQLTRINKNSENKLAVVLNRRGANSLNC